MDWAHVKSLVLFMVWWGFVSLMVIMSAYWWFEDWRAKKARGLINLSRMEPADPEDLLRKYIALVRSYEGIDYLDEGHIEAGRTGGPMFSEAEIVALRRLSVRSTRLG